MVSHRKATQYDWEIGRELRMRRKRLNLSQEDVAYHLGITRQQYGRYERGESKFTVEILEKINNLFRLKSIHSNAQNRKLDGLSEGQQLPYSTPSAKETALRSLEVIRQYIASI